jgi:hypothetical protein
MLQVYIAVLFPDIAPQNLSSSSTSANDLNVSSNTSSNASNTSSKSARLEAYTCNPSLAYVTARCHAQAFFRLFEALLRLCSGFIKAMLRLCY